MVNGEVEQLPVGNVTLEILFDPSGHVRSPISDDEIVERAVLVQALAGREVTLLTYDTGQSTRARAAGLTVIKLSKDLGSEPDGTPQGSSKTKVPAQTAPTS